MERRRPACLGIPGRNLTPTASRRSGFTKSSATMESHTFRKKSTSSAASLARRQSARPLDRVGDQTRPGASTRKVRSSGLSFSEWRHDKVHTMLKHEGQQCSVYVFKVPNSLDQPRVGVRCSEVL